MKEYMDKVICPECGKLVHYHLQMKKTIRMINEEEYQFNVQEALCDECETAVTVPGLDDENETRFERFFREKNNYIQVEEIQQILEKYDIEKRPLSKVLGMGEHTIERYLEGQLPNKKYSIELQTVLQDYSRMQKYYELYSKALTEKAAQKLKDKLDYYEKINSFHSTLEKVALYVLNSKYEITNMSLQKLLYYIEAFAELFLNRSIYESAPQAWMYGPVYRTIYDKYKEFGKNPIVVDLKDYATDIDSKLVCVIDYVMENFGIYNGTVLKEFTHAEDPWINAHSGYGKSEICEVEISHDSIKKYFDAMNEKYHLTEKKGLQKYIHTLMSN